MDIYHKINAPFKRPEHSKGDKNARDLILGDWSQSEFQYLAGLPWCWREKIDGMNIRIGRDPSDPSKISYKGRREKAIIPPKLFSVLRQKLPASKIEKVIKAGPDQSFCLYGEGVGKKIQGASGRAYCKFNGLDKEADFILFDVKIGDWWLRNEDVACIADSLDILHAPTIHDSMPMYDAMSLVRTGFKSGVGHDITAEGLVGTPTVPLRTRSGQRIITKLKHKDFRVFSSKQLEALKAKELT